MKEFEKTREEIIKLKSGIDENRQKNEENITKVKERIKEAERARDTAENAEEYRRASDEIEKKRRELDFYLLQQNKFKNGIGDAELSGKMKIINEQYNNEVKKARKALSVELDNLIQSVNNYNNTIRDIDNISRMLMQIADPKKTVFLPSPVERLIDISQPEDRLNLFLRLNTGSLIK